jgi:O-antigen/teichoic acid export membrane protein
MDVIQKGVSGVRYLVGTQLLSRVFTFILNVLTTRLLAPEIIGVCDFVFSFSLLVGFIH